jgi:hypothetical protein
MLRVVIIDYHSSDCSVFFFFFPFFLYECMFSAFTLYSFTILCAAWFYICSTWKVAVCEVFNISMNWPLFSSFSSLPCLMWGLLFCSIGILFCWEIHQTRRMLISYWIAYEESDFYFRCSLEISVRLMLSVNCMFYSWENRKREFGIKIMDTASELALYIMSMIVIVRWL